MNLEWPPGSDTRMWVGPEVPADKRSGGKLEGILTFKYDSNLPMMITVMITEQFTVIERCFL